MLFARLRRTLGYGVVSVLLAILVIGTVSLSTEGHRVIEEMEQYVDGKKATIKGRPTWKPGITIHVYIPKDPQGKGAEKEVEAACKAWEEKLKAETNANLTFEYHVGQQAPEVKNPPPYVIEVHWGDETTTDEAGSAAPVTDIEGTGKPNEYRRTSNVLRGDITVNRNRSGGDAYPLNAIYNIALHEFGHIFGLDHKTADQDSVIMADRGIDDASKKHPLKDDDARGLQDLYGRKSSSTVPSKKQAEDGGASGTMCCATECGGTFGCVMVNSKAECDGYCGVLQPGVCEKTRQDEQDKGVYGRCNGGVPGEEPCCDSDLGESHYMAQPGTLSPGEQAVFVLSVVNTGNAPAWFTSRFTTSPWLVKPTIELDADFGPGSDPFEAPPAVSSCVPPNGETTITYRALVDANTPAGELLHTQVHLEDRIRRELYTFVADTRVAAASVKPDAATYRWTFTVTPSGLMMVSIPMPQPIASALRELAVVDFSHIGGDLPPMLALDSKAWSISGLVTSPGFLLPMIASTESTATYACLDHNGNTRATLVVEATVARPTAAPAMPFKTPTKIDSDGDTVPDATDACPDVPGDPAFDGCPGYETLEDSDGDGIPDNEDGCPQEPGPLETGGCPK